RLIEKEPAGFGEFDAATDAMKQRGRMGVLQRDDRGADRLLRQVQGFGGPRHVLAFGDGDEDAQLLEGHALTAKSRGFRLPSIGRSNRVFEKCPRPPALSGTA